MILFAGKISVNLQDYKLARQLREEEKKRYRVNNRRLSCVDVLLLRNSLVFHMLYGLCK